MSKFVMSVSDLVFQECKMAMLIKKIDIWRLNSYAKQIDDEKMRNRARESKRDQADSGGLSYKRPSNDGNGRS